jgi:hypothetical protein
VEDATKALNCTEENDHAAGRKLVDRPAVFFYYRECRITCLWHTSKREMTTQIESDGKFWLEKQDAVLAKS